MLSEESVLRSITHLARSGDTDLFPRLPELSFFTDCKDEIAQTIFRMNVGQYQPTGGVEMLSPKSQYGFRIAHQLTATDALFFTSAVVEAAPSIEQVRERQSGDSAFAYRFDPEGGERLFLPERSYHDWLRHLTNFAEEELFAGGQQVLETDIADFYQRIYFHRVENLLAEAGASRTSSDTIKKVVQTCRSRQSFGLPVGSTASRLLAEGVLTDCDRMLRDMGVRSTRYVDDFRIVASPQRNAHVVLCRLAEYLMVTEGLSLNPSKTKIVSASQLRTSSRARLQDVFSEEEVDAFHRFLLLTYEGEDEEHEAGDFVVPFLNGEQLLDRLDEMKARSAELGSQRAILRTLRQVSSFDPNRLIRDHRNLAYYMPRDFSRAIRAGCSGDIDQVALSAAVYELLHAPPISELPVARLWLLNLYVCGTLPPERRIVDDYHANATALEARQLIFIRARLGDTPFFREHRGRLGQVGEWLKSALLIGAQCLPGDEYRSWLDVAIPQAADPLSRVFKGWLRGKPSLDEILAV